MEFQSYGIVHTDFLMALCVCWSVGILIIIVHILQPYPMYLTYMKNLLKFLYFNLFFP